MSSVGVLLNALSIPAMLNIGGMAIPTEGLVNIAEDITISVVKRESLPDAIIRASPDVMPILLTAANVAIPYAGVGVLVVSVAMKYSKPQSKWTAEERQRWWDRAQGDH